MSAKRRRGAQPGNTNALKHGFYSAKFRDPETFDLNSLEITDLESEINAMRVYTRRMLELADGIDNLDHAISILYALSMSSGRVAMLARTQQLLQGSQDQKITAALNAALDQVIQELKLDE